MNTSRPLVLLLAVALGACSDSRDKPDPAEPTRRKAKATTEARIVDSTPPPAKVVEDLLTEQYEEIRKAGGLPLVVTATGKRIVVVPTLYSARCDSCRLVPRSSDEFECHLTIRLSLQPDGRDPSQQGERLFVRRMGDGTWTTGKVEKGKS